MHYFRLQPLRNIHTGKSDMSAATFPLLPDYEDAGAKYKDHDGKPIADLMPWLKEEGMNAMRVRLFVNPRNIARDIRQTEWYDINGRRVPYPVGSATPGSVYLPMPQDTCQMKRIGILSDTHGMWDDRYAPAFQRLR